jgi:hypothetical protein
MCDWNFAFESEFLIDTMYEIMSPVELYKFRHINSAIYNTITVHRIYKKITESIYIRIEKIFGEKTQQFMDMLKRRNIEIYGPFINEVIWGETLDDTCLLLRMSVEDIGNDKDTVLTDYAKIDSDYQSASKDCASLCCYFLFEPDCYGLELRDNITLHVINNDEFVEGYHIYPEVFQNCIKFVSDKFTLFLKYETMVINKIQITLLEYPWDCFCSDDDAHKLYKKYNIRFECKPVSYRH